MQKLQHTNSVHIVFMPFIILLAGWLTATFFNNIIGEWAFIPVAIVYWGLIGLTTKLKFKQIGELFIKPKVSSKVNAMAYIPCLLCMVAFIWGIQVISLKPLLIMLTIIFVVINPIMEEAYWRKYLMDHLEWRNTLKVIFTTTLFALSHPLMWGVFSVTIRSTVMTIPLIVMGIVWSIVYIKTKTIKHCIIAHGLVDLMSLSIWVFLNLYIPPVV